MNLYARLAISLILLGHSPILLAQPLPAPPKLVVPYGQNPAARSVVPVNGIRLYYETYGKGPTMLQIHGNGESIASLRNQIEFFASHYKVIAADSRGHGKSEMGEGRLTYENMAEDMNALLNALGEKRVYVLGWSDGGIVGLLLAIRHPEKVLKLAIMGANLEPSGACDWALRWVRKEEQQVDTMLASGDRSKPWAVRRQHLELLLHQPHITLDDLHKISAPTLVMAGDKDVIRLDHTITIFENLTNAHLCIFPGATHFIPREDPVVFDQTVGRFFSKPFSRPDTRSLFQ